MSHRIALLMVAVPVLSLWIGAALIEILAPVRFLRWRRRFLGRRTRRLGSAQVAGFFDGLTGELDSPEGLSATSVQRRVRLIGLVNLLLASTTALVLIFAVR
jgi:hypothetical protein